MPRPAHSPRPPRYDSALALRELTAADPKIGRLLHRARPVTPHHPAKPPATTPRRLLESFGPTLAAPSLAAAIPPTPQSPGAPPLSQRDRVGYHPTPQQILDCPNAQ